jgi:hypothetical protein
MKRRCLPLVFVLTVVLFLGASCASVNMSRFRSDRPVSPRLPARLDVSKAEFMSWFGYAQYQRVAVAVGEHSTVRVGLTFRSPDEDLDRLSDTEIAEKGWHRIRPAAQLSHQIQEDALSLIETDFRNNIVDSEVPPAGSITCSMDCYTQNTTGSCLFWTLTSGLTLFTINLLGYPFGAEEGHAYLSVRVYDAADSLIGSYMAKGTATSYVAAYWGYPMPSRSGNGALAKATCLGAVRSALDDAKSQIEADMPRLARLIRSGRT